MDLVNERLIEGDGTSARLWQDWQTRHAPSPVTADSLVPAGARAVVVAPHPDDEILGTGGLLAQLSSAGREILLVAATDGEASHPGSSRWPADTLARTRPQETAAALDVLGIAAQTLRLGLPDGGLVQHEATLRARLMRCLRAGDVVFAPWQLDGHPDHEAVARAAIVAARVNGARLIEVPIWGWHWCEPGDPRMPWDRARSVALTPALQQAKQRAVAQFHSQVQADPSTGQGPILHAAALQRMVGAVEVVLV